MHIHILSDIVDVIHLAARLFAQLQGAETMIIFLLPVFLDPLFIRFLHVKRNSQFALSLLLLVLECLGKVLVSLLALLELLKLHDVGLLLLVALVMRIMQQL